MWDMAPNIESSRLTPRFISEFRKKRKHVFDHLSILHARLPYIRKIPLSAILIIISLVVVNLVVWAICVLILISHPQLISTAALAYSLGLRHALDADHISAIDLMTRRLIATGQRPVTVGTFFSLGHSTIVIITSIVVAATAAGVSSKFDRFSTVGGIIGSSVSAVFLIALGIMNAYILYKLILQLQKVISLIPGEDDDSEAWNVQGGGCLFRVLKRMFKLIDRPWKMYPLGILFGLGFDTSSEVALLGISSIQGAQGTSIWLILIFPVLFTVGMCLIDTIDGALMMSLYVAPMGLGLENDDGSRKRSSRDNVETTPHGESELMDQLLQEQTQSIALPSLQTHLTSTEKPEADIKPANNRNLPFVDAVSPVPDYVEQSEDMITTANTAQDPPSLTIKNLKSPTHASAPIPATSQSRVRNPLPFLYYSTILTFLTVICALVIGTVQFLTLLLNVIQPTPEGPFWDGVAAAGDSYEIIGGAICASFLVFGGLSVLCYGRFRNWVDRRREKIRAERRLKEEIGGERPGDGNGSAVGMDVA